jgi:6-phosphogluconolactonase (cycloisomerase 2 family)
MNLRTAIALLPIALVSLAPAVRGDDNVGNLKNIVYVQTNNPLGNSVLAYRLDPGSGQLTEISGSPFLTGGTGYLNAAEVLGPDDTDQEIVATPDHRFLYVTNEGSNTIAGFAVQSDGSLKAVPGSPFPSGGVEPGSIGIDGPFLIVVNRGNQNPGATTGTQKPTYASFLILPEGSLIQIPVPQPSLVAGSSPTQALIAPGGNLMFDSHLFEYPFTLMGAPPFIPPYASELHSYRIGLFGELTPAAQTAPPSPIPPYILGLQVHPTSPILYAGFVVASLLATYTYDANGNMSFVGVTPSGNAADANTPGTGLCWVTISPDAKYLYTSGAITDQIDAYSIAKDPLHPVHLQTVDLNGTKAGVNFPVVGTLYDTTPFQSKVSPDGHFLVVVNHEVSNPGGNATGNTVHVLQIDGSGMLNEVSDSPRYLTGDGVPQTAHPLGVVVF